MKLRSASEVRFLVCPLCLLRIAADDAACTLLHEAPICVGWPKLAASFGLTSSKVEPTAFVVEGKAPGKA